jgi:signal recognition particle receptor subunit beta
MAGQPGALQARILYWGIAGAGKKTNLQTIHAKLKPANRGELSEVPTRLDPTVSYTVLPIEIGEMGGLRTQIQVIATPGQQEQAPTRKQLLDQVNGIVLVIDAHPDRIDENVASVDELRNMLAAYGQRMEQLPIVVQYNRRDLSDPYTIEELHRRLALPDVAVFESVASEGKGVLQVLTTVSKRVVRILRDEISTSGATAQPAAPTPTIVEEVAPEPEALDVLIDDSAPAQAADSSWMEEAILAAGGDDASPSDDPAMMAAREAFDTPFEELAKAERGARIGADLEIVSVGEAQRTGTRSLRVPLVLGNADGETVTLALSISLDPLVDDVT